MRPITLAATAILLLVAACGGSASESAKTAATTASTAAKAAATASSSGAATSPTAAAKTTDAASGGAADACKLITTDEVTRITGVAVAKVTPTLGEPSYCSYDNAAGKTIVGTVYAHSKDFPGSSKDDVVVPGLGDKAKYSATGGSGLQILKRGTYVGMNLSAGAGDLKPEQILDLLKRLGAVAAPRQ